MLTPSQNSCLRRPTDQAPRVLGPTAMGYVRINISSICILTGVEEVVVALGVAGRIKHQFENMVFLDHFLQFEDIMIIHHTGMSEYKGSYLEKWLNHDTVPDCSAGIFPGEDIQAGLRSRVSDYDEKKIELPTYTE